MPEAVMIDVRGAIATARQYLADLLQVEQAQLLLEEVVSREDQWRVAFSYPSRYRLRTAARPAILHTLPSSEPPELFADREVKEVRVGKASGEVQEVVMREPI